MTNPASPDAPDLEAIRAKVEAIATDIVRDVAELPDRTSPPDWPDALIVHPDELLHILDGYLLSILQRDRERIAELTEALKVFAALGDDDDLDKVDSNFLHVLIDKKFLRAARATLGTKGE